MLCAITEHVCLCDVTVPVDGHLYGQRDEARKLLQKFYSKHGRQLYDLVDQQGPIGCGTRDQSMADRLRTIVKGHSGLVQENTS